MSPFLCVVGAGVMGQAVVRGAVAKGVVRAKDILVVEVDEDRRAEVARLGCATSGRARDASGCENILLAVKPQSFAEVAAAMGRLNQPRLVISIMAGIGSAKIAAALGPQVRVIRVMPNTACKAGAGMTAIAFGAHARWGDEDLAQRLFGVLGTTIMVQEEHMHAVTAISGSGPAYVFLLTEAMETAGIRAGLPPEVAATLARQTVIGAGRLLEHSAEGPEALRRAVTSRGGTTEAAIGVMVERDLPGIVADAVEAAAARGEALGA